jgi:XrtJ-associated TM-motif-TM protein
VDDESTWAFDAREGGGEMNWKKMGLILLCALMVAAIPLRAQTGCTDSPEDPTLVLALVSGAGVLATTLFRLRRHK